MAEVRLRLLGRSAQLLGVEDVKASSRARGAVQASTCLAPVVCPREKNKKCTLWPSTIPRGQCMWVPSKMPQIAVPGARFYAQENGRRTRNNNGAQGSEVPLYATRTRYYDLLEVSGNATQSQIKTAYYKQSFRYHPDRNAGNEDATRRFGQVTEAYHVLGTTSLRKKYDRGILGPEDVRNARKPSGRSSSPSRKDTAGQKQTSSTSFSPAKPMFDFDAFYQAHYGEQLAREQFYKQRRAQMEKQKEEQRLAKQMNRMVDVSNVVFFLPFILLFLALKE